jgi:peptidoglycan/xylan/chitin deacetylase (PgdA/CDA1 family)
MKKPSLQRSRELIKVGMATAFAGTGLLDVMARARARASGPRVHVLAYHRVVDVLDIDGPVLPSLCITTESFARQMEQLRRRFQVLSLADGMRAITGKLALERDAAVLTFDDGYRDVLLRAMPILRALELPATAFVPTGYALGGGWLPHDRLHAALWTARRSGIDLADSPLPPSVGATVEAALCARTLPDAVEQLIAMLRPGELVAVAEAFERLTGEPPLDDGARVLDADELLTLAEYGWELGAHTVEHAVLTGEPDARVAHELGRPRRDLERISGRPCRYFAYCNGYHSPRVVGAVRAAGYEGAVTTFDRPSRAGADPFRVGRKTLWEGHARGPDGRFSAALSAAHLSDLFGDLGLTRPFDGEVPADWPDPVEARACVE